MPARGAGAARYGLCGDPPHTPDCDARDGEGTGRATLARVWRGVKIFTAQSWYLSPMGTPTLGLYQ
jgi:hypothetical protein